MVRKLNSSSLYEAKVAVVLASYNGALFLPRQLESIMSQGYQEWDLYVRDDGSQDDSLNIVKKYAEQDSRIHWLVDNEGNLGAMNNFSLLMQQGELASYGFISFSDQDDVWSFNKLTAQLKIMHAMMSLYPGMPLLIHSDMAVVDASLELISPSFMHYQGIGHENNALSVLLTQNFVTGCTVLLNSRLLDFALPIPKGVMMHDWWIALCAVVFGEIGYVDESLVKYRQHGKNEVGAKNIKKILNPFRTNWLKHWRIGRENLVGSIRQAQILVERVKERDPGNENLPLIESYASLLEMPRWSRLRRLNKNNIHCQSRLRHFLMLLRLLSLPKMDA